MKQKQTRFKLKKPLLLAATALLFVAFIVGILEATEVINLFGHKQQFSSDQKQEAAGDAQKKRQLVEQGPDSKGAPSNTPEAPTPSNVIVTAQQESNGSVTIFTKLIGYSGGTCSLSISNGDNTYAQTADIIYQAEFSTCAGFSVPIDKLNNGTWSIKLTATQGMTSNTGSATLGVR